MVAREYSIGERTFIQSISRRTLFQIVQSLHLLHNVFFLLLLLQVPQFGVVAASLLRWSAMAAVHMASAGTCQGGAGEQALESALSSAPVDEQLACISNDWCCNV